MYALREESTLPSTGPATGEHLVAKVSPDTAARYVSTRAELRTRGAGPRYVAVALPEDTGLGGFEEEERRMLILVLWSQGTSQRVEPGRYRILRCEEGLGAPVHVAAYLTRGNAWRCYDAARATEGRIVVSGIARRWAQGAFDVVFPHARLHGTFLARPRAMLGAAS